MDGGMRQEKHPEKGADQASLSGVCVTVSPFSKAADVTKREPSVTGGSGPAEQVSWKELTCLTAQALLVLTNTGPNMSQPVHQKALL